MKYLSKNSSSPETSISGDSRDTPPPRTPSNAASEGCSPFIETQLVSGAANNLVPEVYSCSISNSVVSTIPLQSAYLGQRHGGDTADRAACRSSSVSSSS